MGKFIRICWGRVVYWLGDCPYCYSRPEHKHSCPVCLGEKVDDRHALRDYNWRTRLWRRFRAHIDKDFGR
jgi:hypothetical protein